MSQFGKLFKKPTFLFAVILPIALIVEFVLLEGLVGLSLPTDRGSAVSSFEIREKGTAVHFITHNKRFSLVDLWLPRSSAVETLVLRESFVMDRQGGIEGGNATVKVEALDPNAVRWTFEEAGEQGQVRGLVYEVTKLGCCDAPNTYSYFSLRNGQRLRRSHTELNRDEFSALVQSLDK